jgi:hypothetical protein
MDWIQETWNDSSDYSDYFDFERSNTLDWAKRELIETKEVVDAASTKDWVEGILDCLFRTGDAEDLINCVEELANFYDLDLPKDAAKKFKFESLDVFYQLAKKLNKEIA